MVIVSWITRRHEKTGHILFDEPFFQSAHLLKFHRDVHWNNKDRINRRPSIVVLSTAWSHLFNAGLLCTLSVPELAVFLLTHVFGPRTDFQCSLSTAFYLLWATSRTLCMVSDKISSLLVAERLWDSASDYAVSETVRLFHVFCLDVFVLCHDCDFFMILHLILFLSQRDAE